MRAAHARLALVVAGLASVACVAVAAGSGCAVQDAIVAHEVREAGPPPLEAGSPCTTSVQCGFAVDGGSGLFCDKGTTCSNEKGAGTCQPTSACSDTSLVCGCGTGLVYWNDCLRRQAGESASGSVTSASVVTCPVPKTCTSVDAGQCPTGSYCFLPYDSDCQPFPRAQGFCWVLPGDCPADSVIVPQVYSCGLKACMNICKAIRAQAPIATQSGMSPALCPGQ